MRHIDYFLSAECLRGALITVVIDQPTEQAQQAVRVFSQKKMQRMDVVGWMVVSDVS